MASVIEICNRALSNIGNNRSINSLNEASKEAGQCSLYYESIRDAVLADFDWNFATKTVALADTNNPPLDWDYAYTYPTDCLKIIEIPVPGIRYPNAAMRVQYIQSVNYDAEAKGVRSAGKANATTTLLSAPLNAFGAYKTFGGTWDPFSQKSAPISAAVGTKTGR
ncbi:hypothetical protein ACU63O_11170 [Klebsiella aerogenes]